MRLIGSKTEQDFRRQLIKSHEALFNEQAGDIRDIKTLRQQFPNMITAYVLDWTPEQGEDIVTYLVNTDMVAIIETDRLDPSVEAIIKIKTISEYMKGKSKINRIKIAVALDLARSDLKRNGMA